jgi:LPXTG-motif cell wall-anchored protein
MKHSKSIASAAFAGCIALVLTAGLQADEWNKKTVLTVTEPIEVPSCCNASHTVTLQPGEYVMKLMNSLSDRHIVQVFDKDEKHIITTILAIPNYRLRPTGNTVFQYWEVPAGEPKELRAWFYPGDNFGQEFAYHKQKALQIAAFAKTPVPAIEVDTVAVEELNTVPVVAVDPVQTAERAATPAEPAEAAAPTALPKTASTMPLFGLIGLLSLAAFGVLSIRSRRA